MNKVRKQTFSYNYIISLIEEQKLSKGDHVTLSGGEPSALRGDPADAQPFRPRRRGGGRRGGDRGDGVYEPPGRHRRQRSSPPLHPPCGRQIHFDACADRD